MTGLDKLYVKEIYLILESVLKDMKGLTQNRVKLTKSKLQLRMLKNISLKTAMVKLILLRPLTILIKETHNGAVLLLTLDYKYLEVLFQVTVFLFGLILNLGSMQILISLQIRLKRLHFQILKLLMKIKCFSILAPFLQLLLWVIQALFTLPIRNKKLKDYQFRRFQVKVN